MLPQGLAVTAPLVSITYRIVKILNEFTPFVTKSWKSLDMNLRQLSTFILKVFKQKVRIDEAYFKVRESTHIFHKEIKL